MREDDCCDCESCRVDAFGNPEGTKYKVEHALEGGTGCGDDRGDAEPIRTFDTGATRNADVFPDIYGFTSPLALGLFCQYMHEHRLQADGTMRDSDNWKKGIPMDSYIRSLRRHLQDLTLHHDGYGHLAREDVVSAMAGVMFNIQGYMHEWVKGEDQS